MCWVCVCVCWSPRIDICMCVLVYVCVRVGVSSSFVVHKSALQTTKTNTTLVEGGHI